MLYLIMSFLGKVSQVPSWDLDEREMRVNFWKLNWSTEELGIILTLEWCPRRVTGGGRVHDTIPMIKTPWGG